MFLVSVPRIFEIVGRASLMESVFSKVTGEISTSHDSVVNCITFSGMFRNVALLEISRNSLLGGVAVLQSTSCYASKNELLIRFGGVIGKFQKISWRSSVSSFFLNYRPKNYSPQRCIFLNPGKFLLWSFLWQKQALTGFLQKSCSKQLFGNLDFSVFITYTDQCLDPYYWQYFSTETFSLFLFLAFWKHEVYGSLLAILFFSEHICWKVQRF